MAVDTNTKPQRLLSRRLSIGFALAAAVLGAVALYRTNHYPRTDDAAVFANFIGIAPQVDGPVIRLNVRDNQFVKKGELLYEVDDRPYQYALETAISNQEAGVAAERTFSLRDMINSSFDEVRALADAVLLETGVSRQQDLTLRRRILRWQPRLRMLFITRVALWRYRLQVPGFEMPAPVARAQQEFDKRLADVLDGMANRMSGKTSDRHDGFRISVEDLEKQFRPTIRESRKRRLRHSLVDFSRCPGKSQV
jgi:multidrug efflux pump subunit AcrA (membrane-fusion protein)